MSTRAVDWDWDRVSRHRRSSSATVFLRFSHFLVAEFKLPSAYGRPLGPSFFTSSITHTQRKYSREPHIDENSDRTRRNLLAGFVGRVPTPFGVSVCLGARRGVSGSQWVWFFIRRPPPLSSQSSSTCSGAPICRLCLVTSRFRLPVLLPTLRTFALHRHHRTRRVRDPPRAVIAHGKTSRNAMRRRGVGNWSGSGSRRWRARWTG